MPGYNGSGPTGSGPMTGHGRGYCISYLGSVGKIPTAPGKASGRRRRRCPSAGAPGAGQARPPVPGNRLSDQDTTVEPDK